MHEVRIRSEFEIVRESGQHEGGQLAEGERNDGVALAVAL